MWLRACLHVIILYPPVSFCFNLPLTFLVSRIDLKFENSKMSLHIRNSQFSSHHTQPKHSSLIKPNLALSIRLLNLQDELLIFAVSWSSLTLKWSWLSNSYHRKIQQMAEQPNISQILAALGELSKRKVSLLFHSWPTRPKLRNVQVVHHCKDNHHSNTNQLLMAILAHILLQLLLPLHLTIFLNQITQEVLTWAT